MNEKLTMMDSTEIQNAHVIESGGVLWFYIQNGMTLAEAFAVMISPAKTGTITALRFGEETTYTGYTDLQSIRRDGEQISGCLRKI